MECKYRNFYKFNGFLLDVHGRRLLRPAAEEVILGHRALPVILHLIENRTRVVSYEELLTAHWGKNQFDQNLVEQTVLRIRRKLGDNPEHPQFIRTTETVGYQFIANVEGYDILPSLAPTEQAQGPKIQPQPALDETRPAGYVGALMPIAATVNDTQLGGPTNRVDLKRRFRRWMGGLIILAAVAGLALFRSPLPDPHVYKSTPITQTDQIKLSPLLTDGRAIFFQEQVNTGYRVLQVSTFGGAVLPLRIPLANAELCDLSSDGSTLLLRSLINARTELNPVYVWSLKQAEPRRLDDITAFEANWVPDGRSIIYSIGSDVYTIPVEGGPSRHLFRVPGKPYWFRFSPDGHCLRFNLIEPSTDAVFIWEAGTDGRNPHKLFEDLQEQHCCGNWTPNGRYYLFQARSDGVYQMFARRERGAILRKVNHKPVQLTFAPMSHRGPVVSRDGHTVFVRTLLSRGQVMRYDKQTNQFAPFMTKLYGSSVSFSRDGRSLAYVILPDNTLYRISGKHTLQLTDKPLQVALPRWSPDSEQITFMARYPNAKWKIYIVPVDGGVPQALLPRDDENEADPDWSLNGEKLVFGRMPSRLQSSPERIKIHIFDLKHKTVSEVAGSDGYFSPRWSPTTNQIVAAYKDGTKIALYDVGTRQWSLLASAEAESIDWIRGAGYLNWSVDGNYVYFSVTGKQGRSVVRVNVTDHRMEEITKLGILQQGSFLFSDWVGLSPDGSPLAVQNDSTDDIYALAWDAP